MDIYFVISNYIFEHQLTWKQIYYLIQRNFQLSVKKKIYDGFG